jgi:hypothetical protein
LAPPVELFGRFSDGDGDLGVVIAAVAARAMGKLGAGALRTAGVLGGA